MPTQTSDAIHARQSVIFILADDLGWMDTEPYGSSFYLTPNINRLANKGMCFTDAYAASPLCSPTRASILTGRNPGRLHFTLPTGHEVEEVLQGRETSTAPADQRAATPEPINRLHTDYRTLGQDFKNAGYHTSLMGKWHLGHAPHIPENFGFDHVVGGRYHSGPPLPGNFFAPWDCDTLPDIDDGTHITDVLGDEAVKFLEEKQNDPFFLCLWTYDVHAPFQSKPDLKAKYQKRVDDSNRQRNPNMGAMVDILDQNVGKVLDALERLELEDNTIIVFTSDNGGNMYDVVEGTYPTSNFPLRSGKGNNYEGGVRIPLIVYWPSVTTQPTTNPSVVSSVDFYPTLLEMLDLPLAPEAHLDGVSFLPALHAKHHDRGPTFFHFPHWVPATMNSPSTSVRVGDWKLYRFYHDKPNGQHRYELYNLREDLSETNNLASLEPDKVEEFDALIEQEIKSGGYLIPQLNTCYTGNVVGSWLGNADSEIDSADGVLHMKTIGDHPQITTRVTPSLFEDGILRMRLKANTKGSGKVAFQDGEKWSESMVFPINNGDVFHECLVDLRIKTNLNALSIIPTQSSGTIEIDTIELWTSKRELLSTYFFY